MGSEDLKDRTARFHKRLEGKNLSGWRAYAAVALPAAVYFGKIKGEWQEQLVDKLPLKRRTIFTECECVIGTLELLPYLWGAKLAHDPPWYLQSIVSVIETVSPVEPEQFLTGLVYWGVINNSARMLNVAVRGRASRSLGPIGILSQAATSVVVGIYGLFAGKSQQIIVEEATTKFGRRSRMSQRLETIQE